MSAIFLSAILNFTQTCSLSWSNHRRLHWTHRGASAVDQTTEDCTGPTGVLLQLIKPQKTALDPQGCFCSVHYSVWESSEDVEAQPNSDIFTVLICGDDPTHWSGHYSGNGHLSRSDVWSKGLLAFQSSPYMAVMIKRLILATEDQRHEEQTSLPQVTWSLLPLVLLAWTSS